MASYGRQFELMMTEISSELVKGLFKERGIEFEESDMDFIKTFFNTSASAVVNVTVEKVASSPAPQPKKKKAAAKGKAKAVPEPEPIAESDDESEVKSPEPVVAKGKGKGGKGITRKAVAESPEPVVAKGKAAKGKGKPKCQATTAKGTPCSKCACDGSPFCSVHIKSSAPKKAKEGAAVASSSKAKKVVPKHTHGITSPVPDSGCDLCETHGMPFEIPTYEEEEEDPTFTLEEEDFDEIDD